MKRKKRMSKAIILFDGSCNFCSASISFIQKKDHDNYFSFFPLQSERGQTLLQQNGLSRTNLSTIVFIENGKAFLRSTAALMIAKHLSGWWPLCYHFIIIPEIFRDSLYNLF